MMKNVVVFSFLFIVLPVLTTAQGVVINEIAWMGTSVPEVAENQSWRYEWLELFNAGESAASLNGWVVELRRENLDFSIQLAGSVPAKGYALVASSAKIPQADINYANLGGKFFNGGQRVVLKDAQGMIRDEVGARDGWFAGDNKSKQTMERTDPLKESLLAGQAGSDPNNWHTSLAAGGTPRQENTKPVSSAGAPTRRKKPGFFSESGFTSFLPLHFVLALLVALGSAGVAVLLRRYLRKKGAGSFDDLER
jgi:hypothetical protein